MKVSIIVPAYNAEKTVCAAIDSLLRQTYKNIEIIVVNDGSSDRTAEVLEPYGELIRVIHKGNGGVSSARNRGIQEATGEYLMFADADDLCREDMVESVVTKMHLEQVDFVIAGFTKVRGTSDLENLFGNRVYRSKDEIRGDLETILGNGLNWPFSKLYIKRLILEHHLTFDESLPLGEDMNFNLEYLLCVDSVAYLNKSIYEYLILNSVATTSYREDLYQRRVLSLGKMNATFHKYGMENPIDGQLRIKILYAVVFNLQKKTCPHSFAEKLRRIGDIKEEYFSMPPKKLHGVYKVLEATARILPAWGLYGVALLMQAAMRIFPESIRGVSV